MNVHLCVLGPLENSAYIVEGESNECLLVDAPEGIGEMIREIQKLKLVPKAVLLTHGHFDHIGGLEELDKAWQLPVYVHGADAAQLTDPDLSGASMFGYHGVNRPADYTVGDGDILQVAGMNVRVIHTPGHTPGGCSFLIGEALFAGDTLFRHGVGRTDFPGGSWEILERSIRDRLFTLPETTRVYPGHGPATTIGREKKGNPFLR